MYKWVGHWWLTSVIRRIKIQSQPGQIVCKTLSQKNPSPKRAASGGAQGVGHEFKPQYHKKKKNTHTHTHKWVEFEPNLEWMGFVSDRKIF
jgi:hypothetical protein